MLTRWEDFDDTYTLLNSFRRQAERFFQDYDAGVPARGDAGPRLNLFDAGAALVLTADVPGMGEKDLSIDVTQDVFTLRGERKADAPEGYAPHRQERGRYRFTRSFSLPARVDLERTTAAVKDGVLTVTLPKPAEVRPRQIAVRGALFEELTTKEEPTTMTDTNLQRRESEKAAAAPRRAVAPAVDVFENKDEYLILADLPGAARDKVSVNFERGRLTLEAKREFSPPGQVLASEYAPADYRRSFALPQGVDADRIEATLEAGVLRIRVPKSDATRPRSIAIKGS